MDTNGSDGWGDGAGGQRFGDVSAGGVTGLMFYPRNKLVIHWFGGETVIVFCVFIGRRFRSRWRIRALFLAGDFLKKLPTRGTTGVTTAASRCNTQNGPSTRYFSLPSLPQPDTGDVGNTD